MLAFTWISWLIKHDIIHIQCMPITKTVINQSTPCLASHQQRIQMQVQPPHLFTPTAVNSGNKQNHSAFSSAFSSLFSTRAENLRSILETLTENLDLLELETGVKWPKVRGMVQGLQINPILHCKI